MLQQAAPPAPRSSAVSIPRVEAKAVIDGRLDEPAWQQAARLTDFHQYEPVDGRPAENRTEVLVWYAPDAIHFGIRAHDVEPRTIRASKADRDNIGGEDHVLIYLDTFNDRRRAFLFGVNALGVQSDGVRTEGAASAGRIFGGNTDFSPDYLFDSKGQLTDDGYVVEVRIPFKSLRYPSASAQRWGLQIERKTQRTGYTDTWTDVRRANASFLVQAGTIDGLSNLQRGVVLETQPFFTASANGLRDNTGEFVRDDISPDIGANVKLGFTNVALDGTVNPDFSQVESDAGQVTINQRFALFFPEKRPFFLEGIELFNTPNQLVYTRQVADPIGGAKFTGKVGPFGVAHLTAVDENVNADRHDALFNITRLRTDFGSSSMAGLLVSDRSMLTGDAYNRVVAGDTRVVFKKLYFTELQLGHSWTGLAADSSVAGPIWKFTFDRTGRRWGFNYALNGISDEFITQAGFLPRNGIVDGHIFNRFSYYGKPSATLQQMMVFFGPTRIWRYGEFGNARAFEGMESANLSARLRGGWNLNGSFGRAFFTFDPLNYRGFTVTTAQGVQPYNALPDFSGANAQIGVTTPVWRRVDANASLALAQVPLFVEGSEGAGYTALAGVSVRPTPSIRLNWTGGVQQLYRQRDDDKFARAILSRVRAEYQPSRALFFRAIADYNYQTQAALEDARTGVPLMRGLTAVGEVRAKTLRMDLLVSYEPSPGTVAFFGYGSSSQERPPFLPELQRVNDGFFVKLAYLFRR
jgi:hypothetical protein